MQRPGKQLEKDRVPGGCWNQTLMNKCCFRNRPLSVTDGKVRLCFGASAPPQANRPRLGKYIPGIGSPVASLSPNPGQQRSSSGAACGFGMAAAFWAHSGRALRKEGLEF